MTLEEGIELLENLDRDHKSIRQHIEYLVSHGAEWAEGEEILLEYMRRTVPPPYDEQGFLDEVDLTKKRKKP